MKFLPEMNESRQKIVKIALFVLAGMFLYPPWITRDQSVVLNSHTPTRTWVHCGYSVLSEPLYGGRLDWERLAIQMTFLVLFTAYLLYINGEKKVVSFVSVSR